MAYLPKGEFRWTSDYIGLASLSARQRCTLLPALIH